ncbi:MAG: radical SAM protein [Gemmataceae bacterium]
MTSALSIASVSTRSFHDHDPCRFRPSTRPGVRVVCRLTSRCTLLCDHCLAGAAGNVRGSDLPLAVWQRILAEAREIGAHKVLLTGGEPLLFEGLVELTHFVARMGISTDLNSTLWFMTQRLADELAQAGLTEASVALEGPEAIHDQMHGRLGALRRLRDGVAHLQQAGLLVDGSMCVTPANLPHVEEMIRLAAAMGLKSFTISRLLPVGHGMHYSGPVVSEPDLARLHLALSGARAGEFGIPVRCVALMGGPGREHCRQGQSLVGIRADGTLTPCVLTRDALPDLPRPEEVGLASAVAEMRLALTRIEPTFCFGSSC